ncbi:metalloregulator ArsR/SmtB family transcription factor [Sulfuriferula sp. AH1]|uniref:metalloregulator ArsR/SmtB family transcription factor n=1 Tax=Sulfuriferula sp. AH1 TaxID=1985873 RepID=UPI000B3B53E7|nr:metalloregulator ArsR/SmtB family transcription factor [Sulfuriferula sp. AH1]
MDDSREIKDLLYEQVARISKAASSPKRLELIEVLCQGEKRVEQLASDTELSVKLTSAHLKELKAARLVENRRDGKNIYYRLADPRVADLWVMLRELAEERLLELQAAMHELITQSDELSPISGAELLTQAQHGELVVIDVRPEAEYAVAHLPFARSIPLSELKQRLNEIPANKTVVAYCRGPFCLMAKDAVDMLRQQGIHASRLETGVAEWRLNGLPLATD